MRKILFRGKRVDNGEWAYGDIVHIEDRFFVSYYNNCELRQFINDEVTSNNITLVGVFPFVEVIPESVGQYTGLNDNNGNKIFEGDVLEFKTAIQTYIGRVVLSEAGCWCMRIFSQCYSLTQAIKIRHAKIIGNIHNDPILLKDNKNE